jgi:hypothetical protein
MAGQGFATFTRIASKAHQSFTPPSYRHPVDVKKDQIRAVEVTCPSCGGRGKARVARPDEKICCKYCNRLFRATDVPKELDFSKSDLQRTLVEAAKVARTGPAAPPESVKEYETLGEALEAWREKLGGAPRWALGLAGAAAALLTVWLLWTTTPLLFTSVPDDLAARARFTAEAVARNQSARISAISAFGTGAQAQAWSDMKRPKEWTMGITYETPVLIRVRVLFEDQQKGKACTIVSVWPGVESEDIAGAAAPSGVTQPANATGPQPTLTKVLKPPTTSPPGNPNAAPQSATATKAGDNKFREVHWALFWVLSPRGWMLDGKETLEAGKLR